MMRTVVLSACLGLLVLAPPVAQADAGWTRYSPIIELTATNQLSFQVTLKDMDNPSGCRNKNTFYQDYSSFGSKQMFLLLLEAASNGKLVRLYVTGNCDLNGYSEISAVSMTR